MARAFTKKVENFTCEHCSHTVQGTGYTNHCPKCLWSKHVDVNPGDRAEGCGGMMEPIELELTSGEYSIVHECKVCGEVRLNKTALGDSQDALRKLSTKHKLPSAK